MRQSRQASRSEPTSRFRCPARVRARRPAHTARRHQGRAGPRHHQDLRDRRWQPTLASDTVIIGRQYTVEYTDRGALRAAPIRSVPMTVASCLTSPSLGTKSCRDCGPCDALPRTVWLTCQTVRVLGHSRQSQSWRDASYLVRHVDRGAVGAHKQDRRARRCARSAADDLKHAVLDVRPDPAVGLAVPVRDRGPCRPCPVRPHTLG